MSSQSSIPGTQKLGLIASKILQKMKIFKGKGHIDLEELDSTPIEVARFVTFTRPTEAPQIVDLKALRRNVRPQLASINTVQLRVTRPQADLNSPELHLQRSFEKLRAPTETGTPLRRNPQQAFIIEATSVRSAAAALDDIADEESYEILDEEDSDLDWSLLDLPENIYRRLANESRHSLI